MDRETAIMHIKNLYPPDSDYKDTAKIGELLLKQAKQEVEGWESESTEVLVRFAQLSIQYDNSPWNIGGLL